MMFSLSPIYIISTDEDGHIVGFNSDCEELFHGPPSSMVGRLIWDALAVEEFTLDAAPQYVQVWLPEYLMIGSSVCKDLLFVGHRSSLRGKRAWVFEGRSEKATIQQGIDSDSLESCATHHAITGLPDREKTYRYLHKILAMDGIQGYVFFVALYGYQEANLLAGSFAAGQLIRQAIDRVVEVFYSEYIGAWSSSEFVVVLPGSDSAAVCEKIRFLKKAFQKVLKVEKYDFCVDCYAGAVHFVAGESPYALVQKAATASYAAMESGSRCVCFTPETGRQVRERRAMELQLQRAIEEGLFELHYQPKVCMGSSRIVGAEALVRWRCPEQGLISPGEFLPVAEETGQIALIGKFVLAQACKDFSRYFSHLPQPFKMAVNLSGRQIEEPGLVSHVEALLAHYVVPAEQVEVEITEMALTRRVEKAGQTLADLRDMGLSTAMDDFGTEYSSLAYLCDLPLDTLKVDRSFLKSALQSRKDSAIVARMIDLAKSLELDVVAEGVETDLHEQFIRHHHCDYAQGYLYSKPVRVQEFMELYHDWQEDKCA